MFDFLRKREAWEIESRQQLRHFQMQTYIPVYEKSLAESDILYDKDPCSTGWLWHRNAVKRAATPIVILYSTAKAMFEATLLFDGRPITSPSEDISGICSLYLEMLDTAVRDTPSDLLILLSEEGPSELRGGLEGVITRAKEAMECNDTNARCRLRARLIFEDLSGGGALRLVALRAIVNTIWSAELFLNDTVNRQLLDVYPSLVERVDDLLSRREVLTSST